MKGSTKVYLSGPIDGLNYAETTGWRDYVGGYFHRAGVDVRDPMRQRVYKNAIDRVTADRPLDEVVITVHSSMNSDRGITVRDHKDTIMSDLLFVNLLDARKVSLGTVAEVAWAYDRRITTVVVMEESGNCHEHPMLREMISYRVSSLDDGIRVSLSVLGFDDSVCQFTPKLDTAPFATSEMVKHYEENVDRYVEAVVQPARGVSHFLPANLLTD